MLSVHSKYPTWEISLGGSGERDVVQRKIGMMFFLYPSLSIGSLAVGILRLLGTGNSWDLYLIQFPAI